LRYRNFMIAGGAMPDGIWL